MESKPPGSERDAYAFLGLLLVLIVVEFLVFAALLSTTYKGHEVRP